MIDFKYTQDSEAETPLMFIDKEIGGVDADGKENIQGNEFLKELLYLSNTLGKKNILVCINSAGGIVTEGQSIYAGIQNCKANVNTFCYGIAASIAGVIFQAGKKRIMTTYANLMYHPAYSDDGEQSKGLEALNKSICIMIAESTGKTPDEVWQIMNEGKKDDKGTWMSADMAKENGFCDEIDSAAFKNETNINRYAIATYYNKVLNEKKMSKILNKSLGLHDEASEVAAVAVVDAMNKSLGDLKKQVEDCKDELEKAKKELSDYKSEKNKADEEMKAKADEEAKAKAKKDAEEMDKAADEEMKNAVALGKIKNEANIIKNFKAAYLKDPVGTKEIINSLLGNKQSADFKLVDGENLKDNPAEAQARANGIKPGTAAWYNSIQSFKFKIK